MYLILSHIGPGNIPSTCYSPNDKPISLFRAGAYSSPKSSFQYVSFKLVIFKRDRHFFAPHGRCMVYSKVPRVIAFWAVWNANKNKSWDCCYSKIYLRWWRKYHIQSGEMNAPKKFGVGLNKWNVWKRGQVSLISSLKSLNQVLLWLRRLVN